MVNIPTQYQSLVQEASKGTGLPQSVVAAQIDEESGFDPNAISPAGAEGMFQFLPSTASSYGGGNLFDPNQEVKDYINYMDALLKQEGGSVEKALEAYNAGPDNLAAGAGYAQTILQNANEPLNVTAGGGTGNSSNLTLDAFPGGSFDPLNWPGYVGNAVGGAAGTITSGVGNAITSGVSGIFEEFLNSVGVSSVKDLLIRSGLMFIGAMMVIIGISRFINFNSNNSGSSSLNESEEESVPDETENETGSVRQDRESAPEKPKSNSRQSSPRKASGSKAGRFETGTGSATKGLGKSAAEGAEVILA